MNSSFLYDIPIEGMGLWDISHCWVLLGVAIDLIQSICNFLIASIHESAVCKSVKIVQFS